MGLKTCYGLRERVGSNGCAMALFSCNKMSLHYLNWINKFYTSGNKFCHFIQNCVFDLWYSDMSWYFAMWDTGFSAVWCGVFERKGFYVQVVALISSRVCDMINYFFRCSRFSLQYHSHETVFLLLKCEKLNFVAGKLRFDMLTGWLNSFFLFRLKVNHLQVGFWSNDSITICQTLSLKTDFVIKKSQEETKDYLSNSFDMNIWHLQVPKIWHLQALFFKKLGKKI